MSTFESVDFSFLFNESRICFWGERESGFLFYFILFFLNIYLTILIIIFISVMPMCKIVDRSTKNQMLQFYIDI